MNVGRDRSLWVGARWAAFALLSVALAGAATAPGGGGASDGGSGGGGGSDGGIPQQKCGPMDVAFVLDVTGSMGGAIGSVKAAIPQLLDQIVAASSGDYRAELVVFHDDVEVLEAFEEGNRATIQTLVSGLFASGGNNEPEASDEALRTVIDALGPRPHQTGTAVPFRTAATNARSW